MDETPDQTRAIKLETAKRYTTRGLRVSEGELTIWRQFQKELKAYQVVIPYAEWLAENTPKQPLRMRRDFQRLLSLVEIIAVLHQHQRSVEGEYVIARLEDYFLAKELINKFFTASLSGVNEKVKNIVAKIQELYSKKLAKAISTSSSTICRWLKPAITAGMIEVVHGSVETRINSVKPCEVAEQLTKVLPSIEELAEAFPDLAHVFRAVHPTTGEEETLTSEDPQKENLLNVMKQ
jgi:hypothetical protein